MSVVKGDGIGQPSTWFEVSHGPAFQMQFPKGFSMFSGEIVRDCCRASVQMWLAESSRSMVVATSNFEMCANSKLFAIKKRTPMTYDERRQFNGWLHV